MQTWVLRNRAGMQVFLMTLACALGLILIIALKDSASIDRVTELSGLLLGIILFVFGIFALLLTGKRVVTISSDLKTIKIDDKNLWRKKTCLLKFDDVIDVTLESQGDNEGGNISYDLLLTSKNGDMTRLFNGALFEGKYNKSAMLAKKVRLLAMLKA